MHATAFRAVVAAGLVVLGLGAIADRSPASGLRKFPALPLDSTVVDGGRAYAIDHIYASNGNRDRYDIVKFDLKTKRRTVIFRTDVFNADFLFRMQARDGRIYALLGDSSGSAPFRIRDRIVSIDPDGGEVRTLLDFKSYAKGFSGRDDCGTRVEDFQVLDHGRIGAFLVNGLAPIADDYSCIITPTDSPAKQYETAVFAADGTKLRSVGADRRSRGERAMSPDGRLVIEQLLYFWRATAPWSGDFNRYGYFNPGPTLSNAEPGPNGSALALYMRGRFNYSGTAELRYYPNPAKSRHSLLVRKFRKRNVLAKFCGNQIVFSDAGQKRIYAYRVRTRKTRLVARSRTRIGWVECDTRSAVAWAGKYTYAFRF